jgi:RecA-family ATPase
MNLSMPTPNPATAATSSVAPGSNVICLRPRVPRNLPSIDLGTALIGDGSLIEPQEIVAGLLHAGTKGVLASSSKAGKTWVLLDLATSVASGTPFLKWQTTPGKVLFLNFEIHRAFLKGRLQIVKERKQLANLDNLRVWTLWGTTAEFEDLLEAIIDEIRSEQFALIVLDPIYKMMVGRSENMASGVGVLCHHIEQLVERTGAAVV